MLKGWGVAEGLPQSSVTCLVQTGDGYLWLGTRSGLVRFDGVHFRIFNRWNTAALRADSITVLYEDGGGVLWVGSDGGGLATLDKGRWQSVDTTPGAVEFFGSRHIRSIYRDRSGAVWAGTDYGLFYLKGNIFTAYRTDHGLPDNRVTAISENPQGELLLGTASGDFGIWKGERFGSLDTAGELRGQSVTVIRPDQEGTVWVGGDGGLYYLREGQLAEYIDAAGTSMESVRSLWPGRDGTLWIGTDGEGLHGRRNDRLFPVMATGGLANHFIYALLEDHEGNLWAGTFTEGLFRLSRRRVANLLNTTGSPRPIVNTLLEDRQGILWAGTRKNGLLRIQGGEMRTTAAATGAWAGIPVRALLEDRHGHLWVGTASRGIRVIDGAGPSTVINKESGLASDSINVIFQDRSGAFWVGTDRGLDYIENTPNATAVPVKALSDIPVHVIGEDPQSRLWIGTAAGLYYREKDREVKVEGGKGIQAAKILSLYIDPASTLWVGSEGDGLFCLREAKTFRFTVQQGLADNYIFSILEDRQHRLWMSSNQGIFFLHKQELLDSTVGRAAPLRCVSLDEADGMLNRQCAGGSQPSAWQAANGLLYYPTVRNIAVVNPAAVRVNEHVPPVSIERVIADNVAVEGEANPVLSGDTRMLEFYFTAASFRNPRKIKFRYRLEGYEDEWRQAENGRQRAALYVNLAPGEYTFRVTAANNDGVWNPEGAQFRFRIGSGRKIFFLAAIFILLGAAGLYWQSKSRSLTRKPPEKYKTSALTAERAVELEKKIRELMEAKKIYLDGNLTLKKLSEELMVHPNYLSQIINETFRQSFNDFINRYRIEAARGKLQDPKESHKTILEIAYDTGFYSKSVFNTAFKKFTGMTPSQFRKQQKF